MDGKRCLGNITVRAQALYQQSCTWQVNPGERNGPRTIILRYYYRRAGASLPRRTSGSHFSRRMQGIVGERERSNYVVDMRDQSTLTAPRIFRAQIDGRGTGSAIGCRSPCTKYYPSSPSETASELMKAHRRSTRESTALELVKAH